MLGAIPDVPLDEVKPKLVACVTDKAASALASTKALIEKLKVPEGSVLPLSCGAHNLDKIPSDIAHLPDCKGRWSSHNVPGAMDLGSVCHSVLLLWLACACVLRAALLDVTVAITKATRKNSTIRRNFAAAQLSLVRMGHISKAQKLQKYIPVRWSVSWGCLRAAVCCLALPCAAACLNTPCAGHPSWATWKPSPHSMVLWSLAYI
jgi:hypothetical protein